MENEHFKLNWAELSYFVDEEIKENILNFHAESKIYDCYLANSEKIYFDVPPEIIKKAEVSEADFSITKTSLKNPKKNKIKRSESCRIYSDMIINGKKISKFISGSFCAVKTNRRYRREYASAGSLYPVEIFLITSRKIASNKLIKKNSVYHFLPFSNKFNLIRNINNDVYDKVIPTFGNGKNIPHFLLVYSAYLNKAIFKYGYRGYRHALIECGVMCQLASFVAKQEFNFKNCLYSHFNDSNVSSLLLLDQREFLPLLVHAFGV